MCALQYLWLHAQHLQAPPLFTCIWKPMGVRGCGPEPPGGLKRPHHSALVLEDGRPRCRLLAGLVLSGSFRAKPISFLFPASRGLLWAWPLGPSSCYSPLLVIRLFSVIRFCPSLDSVHHRTLSVIRLWHQTLPLPSPSPPSSYKDPCDYMGPTQITQGNHLIKNPLTALTGLTQ